MDAYLSTDLSGRRFGSLYAMLHALNQLSDKGVARTYACPLGEWQCWSDGRVLAVRRWSTARPEKRA